MVVTRIFLSSAEELPFPDGEFDVVFCDHGAMSFSSTEKTLKEVARVLKTGGLFAFNMQSPFHEMCFNPETRKVDDRLHGDYFALGRHVDEGTVYFQHGFGAWIELFLGAGFRVAGLTELRPRAGSTSTYDYVSYEWARRVPAENIWKLVKV
ncbi:MAG: class I SAM-dependent methyltransferase [Bdellovibrionia bacterium]